MSDQWWLHPKPEPTLVCVYCGGTTSVAEALEHVIPECLGHKDTLYAGAVCTGCNNRFGEKIEARIFREPMMASGQVAAKAEGKNGIRQAIGPHVRKTESGVAVTGGDSGRPHEFNIARVIAKSGVNIVTHHFGSVTAREKCASLIDYVRQPKTNSDIWPFVAVYTPAGGPGNTYGLETLRIGDSGHAAFMFACASGVFAALLSREVVGGSDALHDHLMPLVKNAFRAAGNSGPLMSYVGR